MVYTLTSPTALAVDVACHPAAAALLPLLRAAFALDDDARVDLTAAAAVQPVDERAVAWGVVELLGVGEGTTFDALRASGKGLPLPQTSVLARSRLGSARDVARLLLRETGPWPTGVTAPAPGLGTHPAGAVALAAAAVGAWAGPDLPEEHATTLAAPWADAARAARAATDAAVLGARAGAVQDALDALRAARVGDLARVGWPGNAWVRAMHEAAWAAFGRDRLHAQAVAVLDATAVVVARAEGDVPDPVELRTALRTAHALVVGALLADVLDTDARDCLALAHAGL